MVFVTWPCATYHGTNRRDWNSLIGAPVLPATSDSRSQGNVNMTTRTRPESSSTFAARVRLASIWAIVGLILAGANIVRADDPPSERPVSFLREVRPSLVKN